MAQDVKLTLEGIDWDCDYCGCHNQYVMPPGSNPKWVTCGICDATSHAHYVGGQTSQSTDAGEQSEWWIGLMFMILFCLAFWGVYCLFR